MPQPRNPVASTWGDSKSHWLEGSVGSVRALWIADPAGPCLCKLIIDKRFLEYDESLYSGFFVAIQTFTHCIEGGEAVRLDLRDMSFSLLRSERAIVVGVGDGNADMTPVLMKVSKAFVDIVSRMPTHNFNPLLPSDILELEHALLPGVRSIVYGTQTTDETAQQTSGSTTS